MASLPVRHYVHISRQCRISLLESLRPAVSDARLLWENTTRERSGTVEKSGNGGAETRRSRDSGLPQSICVSVGPKKTISHLLLFVGTGLMIAAHSLSRYGSDRL